MLNISDKETILFHFEKNWEHGIKMKKRHMIIKELSCLLKLFKIVAWDLLSHDFEKFSCYISIVIDFMYVQFNINIIDRVGLPFMWSWFVKLQ